MICVGYNLPVIAIQETSIIHFNYVSFQLCNCDSADFGGATFKSANFLGATFDSANFNGARFRSSIFFNTKFKTVRFIAATFDSTSFLGATFGSADFTRVLFGFADFSSSVFNDVAVFMRRESNLKAQVERGEPVRTQDRFRSSVERIIGRAKSRPVLLRLVTFKRPHNVTFIDFPLSEISFLMTDVRNIMIIGRFEKEILSERLFKLVEKSEHSRFVNTARIVIGRFEKAILSDRLLRLVEKCKNSLEKENRGTQPLEIAEELRPHLRKETVLAEYRNIRKSFERNRTYAEASELFIKEMKLLRSNLKWREKPIHYAYSILSRYGESFTRPLLLAVGVLFITPLILCLLSPSTYWDNLRNTFLAFFQMGKEDKSLEIPLRIISIILFGNMFISFRRRLERK